MTNPLRYVVDAALYARFPDLSTGIVLLRDGSNGSPSPEVLRLLEEVEREVHASMSTESVAQHPHVAAWRLAYSACGVKPSRYRSAVESLLRRVAREGSLPRINAAVDLGNYISIRHVVPVAAYDLATVTQDIVITFADGSEVFEDLAAEGVQHPEPGEVIYKNGGRCLSRRWNWRECDPTKVTEASRHVLFTIEGLNGIPRRVVEAASAEMATFLERICGGSVASSLLHRENPSTVIGAAESRS